MISVKTDLPDALYKQAVTLARSENTTVEELIRLAVAQALGAWTSESYVARRAKLADREEFLRVMAKVPDAEPVPEDKL